MKKWPHEIETVSELLEAWDAGDMIQSLSLGGLGPGYEQAIQIAAVEFARAGKDLQLPKETDKLNEAWDQCCSGVLKRIDDELGGLTGAMFGVAKWLAYQWCHGGGPKSVRERAKDHGQEDRLIQVSKHFPQTTTERTK